MAQYRKRPVVIEAWQWNGEKAGEMRGVCQCDSNRCPHLHTAHENTVDDRGQLVFLSKGDWIIPEKKEGRYYPCKPEVFAETYERVYPPVSAKPLSGCTVCSAMVTDPCSSIETAARCDLPPGTVFMVDVGQDEPMKMIGRRVLGVTELSHLARPGPDAIAGAVADAIATGMGATVTHVSIDEMLERGVDRETAEFIHGEQWTPEQIEAIRSANFEPICDAAARVVKSLMVGGGCPYPGPMNGDRAQFELEHANTKPEDRPDWPLPSFDAQDWAKAFCKVATDLGYRGAEGKPVNEDWMVTWFASALMRGYDEGMQRATEEE